MHCFIIFPFFLAGAVAPPYLRPCRWTNLWVGNDTRFGVVKRNILIFSAKRKNWKFNKCCIYSTWFLLRAAVVILDPIATGPSYAISGRHVRLYCLLSQPRYTIAMLFSVLDAMCISAQSIEMHASRSNIKSLEFGVLQIDCSWIFNYCYQHICVVVSVIKYLTEPHRLLTC